MILVFVLGLIGLGIMVFVHELGHFVAAKTNGVVVEVFSLGWGPRLVGFKRGETMYQISWFPIGGYCKMRGEVTPGVVGGNAGQGTEQKTPGSFNAAAPWRRIVISAAGPIFNLVFAAVASTVIWWAGFSDRSFDNRIVLATDYSLEQTTPPPPATAAGLKSGDRVVAIDGKPLESYQDIQQGVSFAPNKRLIFSVSRDEGDASRTLEVPVTPRLDKDTGAGHIGILPWIDPRVESVQPGSAASIAGLRKGDIILTADGKPVRNVWDLMPVLASGPGKVTIGYQRNGQDQATLLVYERSSSVGPDFAERLLGIGFAWKQFHSPRLGLAGAFDRGIAETWGYVTLTVKGFGLLFQGVNLRNAVAGPLKITYYIGSAAAGGFQSGLGSGLVSSFRLLAFLSVVLFLMNLLPIPAMDGGQIILFLIEIARGRAVPMNLFWRIQVIGFSILLALIVVVTLNDILSFPGR